MILENASTPRLFEAVKLQVEGLVMGGNAGVTNEHRSSLEDRQEDRQLPALLLFPPLEVQAQDCLIHHSCEEKDLLDLLAFRDSPQLVPESNRELGFEKPFLLFGFDWHCWGGMVILTPIVSKPVKDVKYCYIDFVMSFVTPLYAQLPRISGVLRNVPKRILFVTRNVGKSDYSPMT
jgi:hypothetical protein